MTEDVSGIASDLVTEDAYGVASDLVPEEVSGVEGDGSVVNRADGATCLFVTSPGLRG